MFKLNDVVIYGTQGVCRITGTEEKELMGAKKEFWVLKPIEKENATFFVPTDNQTVLSKLRRVLSKQEVEEIIALIDGAEPNWIENEGERRERFKKIISEGDRIELIKMAKGIFAQKKKREAEGKKLHIPDERFLKDAERMIQGEFKYVLQMTIAELKKYVFERAKA